jgi:hypothetical protein
MLTATDDGNTLDAFEAGIKSILLLAAGDAAHCA